MRRSEKREIGRRADFFGPRVLGAEGESSGRSRTVRLRKDVLRRRNEKAEETDGEEEEVDGGKGRGREGEGEERGMNAREVQVMKVVISQISLMKGRDTN